MGNDEIDESLSIVFHSRLPGFPVCYRQAAFFQTPNWLWVWHKKEVCSGKKSQPCFAIHSSARLRLRFWRWAVNHRPSASCTIHAFNIASGFSFNIWPFRCFSNSKNVQHIHLCLEPKLMMQIYTAYPYAPNFFSCIYQQLLNTSYEQANMLKIKYAFLKLLITTNWNIKFSVVNDCILSMRTLFTHPW